MEPFPAWNLYDELGIAPEVSAKVVRAVYRVLTVERHPDTNPGDPAATERMRRLNYAHEVLADDERRAAYDRFRRDGAAAVTAPAAPPERPFVVAADGSGTHATIGAAVADAAAGTTIRLRPGTYREMLDVNASLRFEVDGPVGAATIAAARGDVVSVRGGTVRFHGIVFQHDGPDDDSQTPCAFTVLGGDVTLDECAVDSAHNGIWLQESGSVLVLRDTIVDAVLWAVYARDEAALDLSGCTVASREQNGLHNDGARVTATNTLIQDCGVYGCAASGGSTRLELCEIRRCKADGVIVAVDGVELIGCVVHDNESSGVLVNPDAAPALERCTIYRNGTAGVWISRGASPRIDGCLISEETTAISTYAPATVTGCVIADCSGTALVVQAGGDLTVRASSIERCRAGAHLEDGTATSFADCTLAGCALVGIEADDGARLRFAGGTIYDCNVGVLANRSEVELHGATIAANGQGGVQHNGAAMRVSGCAIRGNRGHGIDRYAGGSLDLRGSDLSGNAAAFEPARATAVRLTQAGNTFADVPADWRADPYVGGRDFQRSHTFRFYAAMEAVVGAVSAFARAQLYEWQNDGSSVEPDGRHVSFAFRRSLGETRLVKPRSGPARAAAGLRAYQGDDISAVAPVRYELRASCAVARLDEFRTEVALLVSEHIGASAGAYNLDAYTAPAWCHTEGYPGIALDAFLSSALVVALRPAAS
jgi:hypothetical protein